MLNKTTAFDVNKKNISVFELYNFI